MLKGGLAETTEVVYMAFTHYRTKGIFLKKEDRGEADQVFTLFTEEFGKVRVLARGIRKITSKLRAGADVFYFSEIEFIQGKQYKTLTDAVLIDKFEGLRQSPGRLEAAYKVADVLDCLTAGGQGDVRIWNLLHQTLQALFRSDVNNVNNANKDCLGLTSTYFLWNLFGVLGYGPELYNCACCRRKLLPETFFFVPQEGGVVCWQCFQKKNSPPEPWCDISVGTVKVLRFFLREPLDIAERLKIQSRDQENLQNVTGLYLNFLKQTNNPQQALDK